MRTVHRFLALIANSLSFQIFPSLHLSSPRMEKGTHHAQTATRFREARQNFEIRSHSRSNSWIDFGPSGDRHTRDRPESQGILPH